MIFLKSNLVRFATLLISFRSSSDTYRSTEIYFRFYSYALMFTNFIFLLIKAYSGYTWYTTYSVFHTNRDRVYVDFFVNN